MLTYTAPDKHSWMPERTSEVLSGEDHLCAKRQYPKITRDSRDVAEAIVMISRMKESYLACAAKASRPVQAQCLYLGCPDVARMIV